MKIPTEQECVKILEQNNPRIISHSIFVKDVSLKIADIMIKNGFNINKELVKAGALLHDVKKRYFHGDNHHIHGRDLVLSLGYPEVSEIVAKHVYLIKPETYEEKIVYYADKICNPGNKLVDVNERFKYVMERYNLELEILKPVIDYTLKLEKELLGENGKGLL